MCKNCPSSYKIGHRIDLSYGGSDSSVGLIMQPAFDFASGDVLHSSNLSNCSVSFDVDQIASGCFSEHITKSIKISVAKQASCGSRI